MKDVSRADRVKGAIVGALVGDALGVGPYWFHSKEEIEAHYGPWVEDYVAPVPGRKLSELEPGESSPMGRQVIRLLESVAACGGYDEADFTRRAREAGVNWSEIGGFWDTSNAAVRQTVLGVRYAADLELAMEKMIANTILTHYDPFIVGQSVAFGLNVSAVIMGVPIDKISNLLMTIRKESERMVLPDERVPAVDPAEYCPDWIKNDGISYRIPVTWLTLKGTDSPGDQTTYHEAVDAVYQFRYAYDAVNNPGIAVEPAGEAVTMFGLPCQMSMVLPAAYYLAARYEDDFETAVLTAVNSPGQNMARAALTGALTGGLVGLTGIPGRFIEGLADHERLVDLASQVAALVERTA